MVEFMRVRRDLELELLRNLPVRSHIVDVSERDLGADRRSVIEVLESDELAGR